MIDGSKIIEKANSYKGKVKYQFGTNNIDSGVGDCSSFTQHIYKTFGVNIGRDTQAQYTSKYGKSVSKSELSEGDLVFFRHTYPNNNTDGVSHVGIYMGGNDFIHLGSTGVKVSSLNENYWSNHYLGAKHYSDVAVNNDNNDNNDNNVTNKSKSNKYKVLEFLGVEVDSVVNSIIVVLFLIGGIVLIGLSIGGI